MGVSGVIEGHKETTGVMDLFIITVVLMVSWVHTYVKTYLIVPFKYEQFVVCQLYLKLFKKELRKFKKL